MPCISVIIPTHKRPRDLSRALKSVMAQTFSDIEILVVNDDRDTEEEVRQVIEEFGDERIKYHANDRTKGANGARNVGILKAQGTYITFLDDDDEFMESRLEELAEFTGQTGADAVLTNYYMVVNNKDVKNKSQRHTFDLKNFLEGKVALGSGSNLFLKKSLIDRVGLWNERLAGHQDLEFVIRVLADTDVHFLDKRLLRVYGHNGRPDPFALEKIKANFFDSIRPYIQHLDKKTVNTYYADHYSLLALSFGDAGFIKKMLYYGWVSLKFKIRSPEKYVRFVLCLIKKYMHIDTDYYWRKLKMKFYGVSD